MKKQTGGAASAFVFPFLLIPVALLFFGCRTVGEKLDPFGLTPLNNKKKINKIEYQHSPNTNFSNPASEPPDAAEMKTTEDSETKLNKTAAARIRGRSASSGTERKTADSVEESAGTVVGDQIVAEARAETGEPMSEERNQWADTVSDAVINSDKDSPSGDLEDIGAKCYAESLRRAFNNF